MRAVVNVTRAMEDVIANCLDSHMATADCTEAAMEDKFNAIEAHARTSLPAQVHEQLSTLVELLADKHMSRMPSVARRLAASVMNSSAAKSVMAKLAAHEA